MMARPKTGGVEFYLGRAWWRPDRHSPALRDFLAALAAAGSNEKLALLQSLLDGAGFNPADLLPPPAEGEDEETRALLDEFLK
jgi:hypothetical protein